MKRIIRIILLIIWIPLATYMFFQNRGEASLRKEFNEIVTTLIDAQKYDEAIIRLETLQQERVSSLDAVITENIALCYFRKAQDDSLTGEETIKFLTKAFTLDPKLYEENKDDYPTIVID